MLKRLFLATIFMQIACVPGLAQESPQGPVRFIFWNVENAFDTFDDTLKKDDDYLPDGIMRWTYSRYRKKITGIYRTIVAAGGWDPPEIIAFCEIESMKVLEDLIHDTGLSKFDYQIVHEESPDERGIDVCLIFRADRLRIISYSYLNPLKAGDFRSRTILHATASTGGDTLEIMVNHWPSRLGGVLASEDKRMQIASFVRSVADSINNRCHEGAKIIITGDFNCSPGDDEMVYLTNGTHFKNLSAEIKHGTQGTYRYRGLWEMIDQVIVSQSLLKSPSGLFVDNKSLEIFSPEFLLTQDLIYPGLTPFATYKGFRYQGGYSDHLPVILTIKFRPGARNE